MSTNLVERLAALGCELPDAPAPAANYAPYVISGKQLWISGQLPFEQGHLIKGKLGHDLGVQDGVQCAKRCALAILAQANAAVDGDFSKIARLIKLTGFVNSRPDFVDQPQVINGASDLMAEVMGEAGIHARAAVSSPSLPLGAAVEIEAVFELA